jgi:heterodisulfide reductase subunit B
LCEYNLGQRQEDALDGREDAKPLPVLYFTQMLAVALGLETEAARFDKNTETTRKFLEQRKILASA